MDKDKKENSQPTKSQTSKRSWQRPELQKLRVSLDTASDFGSGGDGAGRTSLG
jgi:hypothetical protein